MITQKVFKNNSQYVVPKVLKNKKLLNFNIDNIHIEKDGNVYFLYIGYIKLSKKQRNYLKYIINISNEVHSYGYDLYNDKVLYSCRILIPSCLNLFVDTCNDAPDFIPLKDIKETIIYFRDYKILF